MTVVQYPSDRSGETHEKKKHVLAVAGTNSSEFNDDWNSRILRNNKGEQGIQEDTPGSRRKFVRRLAVAHRRSRF